MRKLFIFSFCLGLILLSGCSGCDYSSGARVGILTKFSKKGVIWKTYEGEMNLGGLKEVSDSKTGATSFVANLWEFSIKASNPNAESLAKQLNEALENGNRVKITYDDRGMVFGCWHSSTHYWITKVEILE